MSDRTDSRDEVPESGRAILGQIHHIVQAACMSKGWTMARLAEELGITESHLERALEDPRLMTISRLAKIADMLGVRIETRDFPKRGR